MWIFLRWIGMLLFLVPVCWAQNPADISFTLNAKGGKTVFRLGEPVFVELGFQSPTSGRYQVITDPSQRVHLRSVRVYDQFRWEPSGYVVDPLREQTRLVEALFGPPPRLAPVTASPVVIQQVVNDCVADFRIED